MIVNIKEEHKMELRDLQIFQSVADRGSVSGAKKGIKLRTIKCNRTY